jgi:hypothetical protein
MLERGKDVGLPQQLEIGLRAVAPDGVEERLKPNHAGIGGAAIFMIGVGLEGVKATAG